VACYRHYQSTDGRYKARSGGAPQFMPFTMLVTNYATWVQAGRPTPPEVLAAMDADEQATPTGGHVTTLPKPPTGLILPDEEESNAELLERMRLQFGDGY